MQYIDKSLIVIAVARFLPVGARVNFGQAGKPTDLQQTNWQLDRTGLAVLRFYLQELDERSLVTIRFYQQNQPKCSKTWRDKLATA